MNFDNYTGSETQWRDDADARELADLRREESEMREYSLDEPITPFRRTHPMPWNHDAGPECCENPQNFLFRTGYEIDPETGYRAENYFECVVCRSRIAEEDFSALCIWANQQPAFMEGKSVRRQDDDPLEKVA
jgi:hypothetical protein